MSVDILDNFYYNMRNVKTLKFLRDETFVDYPGVLKKEYGFKFPKYSRNIHLRDGFEGFCLFGKKEEIKPAGSYDDSYVYVKDGQIRFYQKSRGITDRMQVFSDMNYSVRKDFLANPVEFFDEDYFDPDLVDDPLVASIASDKILKLGKSDEYRHAVFYHSDGIKAGLEQWGDDLSYTLNGGAFNVNSCSLTFNIQSDLDIVKFLNDNMGVFSNLELMLSYFGRMPVESYIGYYDGNQKVFLKDDAISFNDAVQRMKDSTL